MCSKCLTNDKNKNIFAIVTPIIEYRDYRKFIQDYYDERKRSSAFTWRDFAAAAGFSSAVYLKYVCEGKKNLSIAAADQVAVAMGLAGFELDFFKSMVAYSHAKNDAAKQAAFDAMLALAKEHKVNVLEGDAFKFFSSWKNPVIRELAPAMPGAKPLEMARKCRAKITAAEVSETLAFLTKTGLLKKDKFGNYKQTSKSVSTGPMDVTPMAVRRLHHEMGMLALEAIEGAPLAERNFTGVTLGLTQEAYCQIVKELAAFRHRVVAIATNSSATERVYRLNMQLFPMTETLPIAGDKSIKKREYKRCAAKPQKKRGNHG